MSETRLVALRISEIFGPTIQGEGPLIGRPTVFVRTFGCDYRCAWCDSLHAVLPEHRHTSTLMTPNAVLERVRELAGGPILVTLSGGNPALQPLSELIEHGNDEGYEFALETQGSVPQRWFRSLDYLILSPKPPSSGETPDREKLHECLRLGPLEGDDENIAAKVVVFDEADLDFALDLHRELRGLPFYLQVGNPTVAALDAGADDYAHRLGLLDRLRWLSEQVIARRAYDVIVLPQLHTLMWGNQRAR